jgi:hypothetical protein
LTGDRHRVGRSPLLTSDAERIIIDLVRATCAKHEPITIGDLTNQIHYFFGVAISANMMSHIVHWMRDVKMVKGIPMDNSVVMADLSAIDGLDDRLGPLLAGVPRGFVMGQEV